MGLWNLRRESPRISLLLSRCEDMTFLARQSVLSSAHCSYGCVCIRKFAWRSLLGGKIVSHRFWRTHGLQLLNHKDTCFIAWVLVSTPTMMFRSCRLTMLSGRFHWLRGYFVHGRQTWERNTHVESDPGECHRIRQGLHVTSLIVSIRR